MTFTLDVELLWQEDWGKQKRRRKSLLFSIRRGFINARKLEANPLQKVNAGPGSPLLVTVLILLLLSYFFCRSPLLRIPCDILALKMFQAFLLSRKFINSAARLSVLSIVFIPSWYWRQLIQHGGGGGGGGVCVCVGGGGAQTRSTILRSILGETSPWSKYLARPGHLLGPVRKQNIMPQYQQTSLSARGCL